MTPGRTFTVRGTLGGAGRGEPSAASRSFFLVVLGATSGQAASEVRFVPREDPAAWFPAPSAPEDVGGADEMGRRSSTSTIWQSTSPVSATEVAEAGALAVRLVLLGATSLGGLGVLATES